MLDEFAYDLVRTARLPTPLSPGVASSLVSRAYLHWLANRVFASRQSSDIADDREALSRLSLATSILLEADGEESGTAFLVAEAADVAQSLSSGTTANGGAPARFRRAVHQLDVASFFHFSDFDGNAAVLARRAGELLASEDYVAEGVTTDAHLDYYRTLARFLHGELGRVAGRSEPAVEAVCAEERAFLFLSRCVSRIANRYLSREGAPELVSRLRQLEASLTSTHHPYSALGAEVHRVIHMGQLVERKSLFGATMPTLQPRYREARLSGTENGGYAFAWPPTRQFCDSYLAGQAQHAVITVPTGAGKGLLAELAVVDALQHGWVLYLAPTNALCAQVSDQLKQALQGTATAEVDVFYGTLEYTEERPVFERRHKVLVITPEKALLLLKRESDEFSRCSLAVLDECHILGERIRGDIAEMVLAFAMAKNPDMRIVMMSALVSDGDDLARWLEGTTGRAAAHIASSWRPTRIARLTVLPDWPTRSTTHAGRRANVCSVGVRVFGDPASPWRTDTPLYQWPTDIRVEWRASERMPWRNQVSRKLAEAFATDGIATLLIMLKNRHHAFSVAGKFTADLPTRPSADLEEDALYRLALYELGTASALEQLIDERGIAVHTSAMLDCERRVAELAFRRGRAIALAATPTLSQGLNLVAEAVVICGTEFSQYGEFELTSDDLGRASLAQVLNAAGRAARASVACRGATVIVPDRALSVEGDSSKAELLRRVRALGLRDASLPTDSSIRDCLDRVERDFLDQDPNSDELHLLSLLPWEWDALRRTLLNTYGAASSSSGMLDQVMNRLEWIRLRALERGCDDWVLRASSLAAVELPLAEHLRDYIAERSAESTFLPPSDSYQGWARFLLHWVRTLPPQDSWRILRPHIKAWRWSWGSDGDEDLIEFLDGQGYPTRSSTEVAVRLEPIWENLRDVVDAWMRGETLLGVSRVLTRRPVDQRQEGRRTDARHLIPRAIAWRDRCVRPLSLWAGLLLALQNQWLDSEPESTPPWMRDSATIHTLPMGLRFGVVDPVALAWYRRAIRERRAANLLRRIVPIGPCDLADTRGLQSAVSRALHRFRRDHELDDADPVIPALRRIL
jgi:hypothetical protein